MINLMFNFRTMVKISPQSAKIILVHQKYEIIFGPLSKWLPFFRYLTSWKRNNYRESNKKRDDTEKYREYYIRKVQFC